VGSRKGRRGRRDGTEMRQNGTKRSSPDLEGGRMKLRERQDDRMGLRGKQKNYEEAGWD
jgi:hypothetical protein